MPVRGTSEWGHAIIEKKAINMDHAANGGDCKFVMCAWDTCEKDGFETYKVVTETGNVSGGYESRPLTYIFCCERHRQYWIHSAHQAKRGYDTHRHGDLPSGYKGSII